MQYLLLQTFAWMLLAGLVGAMLGCLARRMFTSREAVAVAVPAAATAVNVSAPVVARVAPKSPVVEGSKAPVPVTPAAPVTAPDRGGAYSYPVTTVGIPRGNPEKIQPQIQTINLPAAAAGGAGSVAAAVTIRQAAPASGTVYPITTIGIPPGYVETVVASTKPDAARFDRALSGEQGQPRPEPLRPELARNTSAAAPAAASVPATPARAPLVPAVAATVAPAAAPVAAAPARVASATVAPAKVAPLAPAAPVAPAAPLNPSTPVAPSAVATVSPRAGTVPNAPIESKPAGIAAGSLPAGPIASKPAGIPALETPAAAAPAAPVKVAEKTADVPFEPVVAGGAALAAIAARAASAAAAAAASATPSAAVVAPVPAAVPSAPVTVKPAAPVAAPPGVVAPAQPVAAGDDLMRIRSIDSVLQGRLKSAGVLRFSEIARWTPGDVARISQTVGLTGRIEQENWIEQAQILATGGETEYSRRRLRGEVPTAPPVTAPAVATARPPASVAPTPIASAAPTAVAPVATVATAPAPAVTVAPPAPAKSTNDMSMAAATAAAAAMASAAMASAAIVRATANVEPAMPSKLVDAIRENLTKPAAAAPVVAAATVAVTPAAAAPAEAGRVSRPDLAGLRSVRSEALRDGPPVAGRGSVDDLKRIRGIGVLIEKKLNSLGVNGYEQVANWTIADIDRVSQILDFKGRIERENWVEQARILASGGQTEFSKRVDRGEA